MTYEIEFVPSAYKEWNTLGDTVRKQFKNKLAERIRNPKVPKDKLSGHPNLYKIKLRTAGYRLVYEVDDKRIVILILSVGKRNRSEFYTKAFVRL